MALARPVAGPIVEDTAVVPPALGTALVLSCGTAVGLFLLAWLQFAAPGFVDYDSYYHSKAAWLLIRGGLLPFTWLPETVLAPGRYVDHHFLFHLLAAPFVNVDILVGGKWAAVACAACALATLLVVLPGSAALPRLIALILFFAASPGFLYRMSMLRAQSLSLVLLLLLWHALKERRDGMLLILTFLYVWSYNAFPLALVLIGSYTVAALLRREPVPRRQLYYGCGGIILGAIVNPFFPKNVIFLYYHLIDKATLSGYAVGVGGEWYPFAFTSFLIHLGVPSLLFLLACLPVLRLGRRCDIDVLAALLFTAVTLVMACKSKRFVELFPPFAILALAASFDQARRSGVILSSRCAKLLLFAALGALPFSLSAAARDVQSAPPYEYFAESAQWLAEHSAPGELIWTADWDDFPRLFHHNHHNSYLAGLDPYFSYSRAPRRYTLWARITRGRARRPLGPLIRRHWPVRFAFVDRRHTRLHRQLRKDPTARLLLATNDSSVYGLWPSAHAARAAAPGALPPLNASEPAAIRPLR